MPLRINALESQDPATLCVTKDEFNNGRQNFDLHYSCKTGEYTGQDFKVSWDLLQQKVEDYKTQFGVPEEQIAMRFIHCFNTQMNNLFLTLNICQMQWTPITDNDCQVWALLNNTNQVWYDLTEGSIAPSNAGMPYQDQYLNSFLYKADPASAESELLAEDGGLKFARTLTFPWKNEILQMYIDNGSPAGADIHFGSCSYTEDYPGEYSVEWPHGMVLYLQAGSTVYLDNNASISIFSYKGADSATMCPPKCDCYIVPIPATTLANS